MCFQHEVTKGMCSGSIVVRYRQETSSDPILVNIRYPWLDKGSRRGNGSIGSQRRIRVTSSSLFIFGTKDSNLFVLKHLSSLGLTYEPSLISQETIRSLFIQDKSRRFNTFRRYTRGLRESFHLLCASKFGCVRIREFFITQMF